MFNATYGPCLLGVLVWTSLIIMKPYLISRLSVTSHTISSKIIAEKAKIRANMAVATILRRSFGEYSDLVTNNHPAISNATNDVTSTIRSKPIILIIR